MKLVGNRIYLSGYTDVNFGTNDFVLLAVNNDGSPLITGITNINPVAAMKLFPNPSTETITIEFNRREKATVQILDVSGVIVQQVEVPASSHSKLTVNIKHLSAGQYRVVVYQKTGSQHAGFIKLN